MVRLKPTGTNYKGGIDMKTAVLVLSAIFLLGMNSVAGAFDGHRKGFLLGFGLGFCPIATSSHSNEGVSFKESGSGLASSFQMGYGWNEINTIVLDVNITKFSGGLYDGRTSSQSLSGLAWYHYYGEKGKAFFTTLGVGFMSHDLEGSYISIRFGPIDPEPKPVRPRDDGPGVLLGGGYEFSPHWQIGGFLSSGKTSSGSTDFSHAHFSVMVQGTFF